MHWRQFLFLFTGRISRLQYWGFVAVITPAWLIAAIVDSKNGYEFLRGPFAVCVIFLLLWPSLAVQAKRWHDRDMSAWWILIHFIPLVGPIGALIVNGFLRGTNGRNKYGPDPLEQS
jgi:uncharacterized membrane protein YhaH (DUF805 family)